MDREETLRGDAELARAYRVDAVCDSFETAWLADTEPQIEVFLGEVPESDRRLLFRELLKMEMEFRSVGDCPDADAWSERFPEYASVIRDLFCEASAESYASKQVAETIADVSQGRAKPADALGPGATFGHYRILRRLGVGGMGIVFLARQLDVKRRVALKVIRTDAFELMGADLQRAMVERFQNEAQAAAQLDHPGIITVFEVGQVEGRHYLAMRYVEGPSLSQLLRAGPLENDRAARYCEQVARAVAAAHQEGVLHRDLKPQNILIEAGSDQAMVADFGLAKLVEAAPDLTKFGELMGTPQYMAPEQAQDAGSVTARADIYAIGATLYHLLTGRPPFQAANAVETVQQLLHDDPISPRQLNRAIDQDLETICLKCLEKEPDRRYHSAAELAEDLRRRLQNLPIHARRIGILGRSWRWCRRNPVVAGLTAAVAASLLATLTATTVGYLRTSAAQQASEEGFRDARLALDHIVARVREEPLFDQPELDNLKHELLSEALTYYQDFLTKRSRDATLQAEVAATYFRIGLINEHIASTQKALEALQQAQTIQSEMLARQPSDVGHLTALGSTQNAIGRVYADREDWHASRRAFEEAITTRTRLTDLVGRSHVRFREYQRMLVNSQMNLGITLKRMGDLADALEWHRLAQQLRKELLQPEGNDARLRTDIGIGYYNMGTLAQAAGDQPAAAAYFSHAVEQLRLVEHGENDPLNQQVLYALSVSLRLLGDLQPEYIKAADNYRSALATLQPLVDHQSDLSAEAEELAQIYMNLGQLEYDSGRLAEAIVAFEQAVAILNRLARLDTTILSFQRNLGWTWREMGRVRIAQQDFGGAKEYLANSESWFKELCGASGDPADQEALLETQQLLAEISQ